MRFYRIVLTVLALSICIALQAQENAIADSATNKFNAGSTDLFEMSLEELLNVEVTVATKTGINQRETPGIV